MPGRVLPMTATPHVDPFEPFRCAVSSGLVLLVDGDPDARLILRRLLEHYGYEAIEAVDHDSALAFARDRDVALIVSELFVARGSGATCLVESVKADAELCDIPVLIVTTQAFAPAEQRAREAGSAGYIVKPFAAAGVMAEVARLTESVAP
jgi:CheY-like chemotaxis protein